MTIFSSQMDMGQGIYHGIATLVQEELDADWAKVSVVGAVREYGAIWQPSIRRENSDDRRVEGHGLVLGTLPSGRRNRAGDAYCGCCGKLEGPGGEIKAENGIVSHASGKSATYGALAASAASGPVPSTSP